MASSKSDEVPFQATDTDTDKITATVYVLC